MKKILILLMALSLAGFLACGDDEGESGVSMSISTEDGVEQMGNIVPGDPLYTLPSDVAEWLKYIQVQVYANNKVIPRNLVMSRVVGKNALIAGDYLVMDIPAGRDLIFVVNAADINQVIQYSGTVGPLNIRPKSIIPINVILKRTVPLPNQVINFDLTLKTFDGSALMNATEMSRFNITTNERIFVNIYTQAKKVGDQWVPTNPVYPTGTVFDPQINGTYNAVNSRWETTDNFLDNMLMFITVHIEDDNGGLVFYGIRAYDHRWGDNPLLNPIDVYMQHPTRLIIRFNSITESFNVTATMFVNGQPRALHAAGTYVNTNSVSPTNPIAVFDSPSGQEWFTGNSVQNRLVAITRVGYGIVYSQSIPVDWGTYTIDIP